jgi:excisionase family DNA binding protein
MEKKQIERQGYNRKEAAGYLGVSENTLVKLCRDGYVGVVQVGRRKIYNKGELDRFLSQSIKVNWIDS